MTRVLLIALLAIPSFAYAQSTPTLVQQLTSYLAYEQAEAAEECPGGGCYHYWRAQRLTKQLAAAISACNAGACLPPILGENGQVNPPFSGSPTSRGTL
jgi:peptidoglycan/LPS O-acetylase OafA/YrhL